MKEVSQAPLASKPFRRFWCRFMLDSTPGLHVQPCLCTHPGSGCTPPPCHSKVEGSASTPWKAQRSRVSSRVCAARAESGHFDGERESTQRHFSAVFREEKLYLTKSRPIRVRVQPWVLFSRTRPVGSQLGKISTTFPRRGRISIMISRSGVLIRTPWSPYSPQLPREADDDVLTRK